MSASVPLGEAALFMCGGKGISLFWEINGQADNVPASKERGVKVIYDTTNAPVFKSKLTIPATMENDNVTIQCAVILGSKVVYSPVAFLTVLGKLCTVDM